MKMGTSCYHSRQKNCLLAFAICPKPTLQQGARGSGPTVGGDEVVAGRGKKAGNWDICPGETPQGGRRQDPSPEMKL